jgi:hypothetical protein
MINKERMVKALTYLAETDEECAALRADHARAKFRAESICNAQKQASTAKTVAERQTEAEISKAHTDAKLAEFEAFFAYESMKNKRATECIVIDTWRSLNAARNKGQIV